jgi:hypothetical protein
LIVRLPSDTSTGAATDAELMFHPDCATNSVESLISMFYEPRKKNHGLPHDPYNAIVGPRPIGWITSVNLNGDINLAPYSYFNSVSTDPPIGHVRE